jgi:hypothetical protein
MCRVVHLGHKRQVVFACCVEFEEKGISQSEYLAVPYTGFRGLGGRLHIKKKEWLVSKIRCAEHKNVLRWQQRGNTHEMKRKQTKRTRWAERHGLDSLAEK